MDLLRDHRADDLDLLSRHLPLPTSPVAALEPFRIANRYGLFAVMTRGRYEIEFQGSNDGENWTTYPFRYKPQDLDQAAPHLRTLSAALRLESVVRVAGLVAREHHRAQHRGASAGGRPDVLALFAGNPFPQAPPKQVRAVHLAILVYDAGGEASHAARGGNAS